MRFRREYLKSKREAMGLTQEELARATGVSVFAVSRWESGKSEPGLEEGCKLGAVLRVKVEEWMEADAGDETG
mgnify:CR=1 FL=1